ncbi:MAG TPA: phosphate ABC transporter permease PstA [Kofleriaceae bacterium]|nr:phosphate ABC transporter permease PstA [Kofleriaceae bacterium]
MSVRTIDLAYRRRKLVDATARGLCIAASVAALIPLAAVLLYVGEKGLSGLSWDFFTELPIPVGEVGGGMKHAIVGTLICVGIASAIGIPIGILAGVYLAEFGDNRLGTTVRFSADVMNGVPSITVGIFVYTLVVLSMGHFSALAGGIALSILMIPTVMRTTEEMLRMVPASLREAALALGAPKRRAIVTVALRTAASGIATGVMLAVARVSGETAPLLFTALGNDYYSTDATKPIATLSVQIYTYAVSPYDDWHAKAWAAALLLVTMILVLNLSARALVWSRGARR